MAIRIKTVISSILYFCKKYVNKTLEKPSNFCSSSSCRTMLHRPRSENLTCGYNTVGGNDEVTVTTESASPPSQAIQAPTTLTPISCLIELTHSIQSLGIWWFTKDFSTILFIITIYVHISKYCWSIRSQIFKNASASLSKCNHKQHNHNALFNRCITASEV